MAPSWLFFCILILNCGFGFAQLHPEKPAEYKRLPSLRERAAIQDEWTAKRINNIPALLKKYNLDAWLICQREHAEDTIWWSIKNATDFDSHRRSVILFHSNHSSLAGALNPIVWIDNTDAVWPELRATFEAYEPDRIMLNNNEHFSFAGGLHVGELEAISRNLGWKWMERTVNQPMLAMEFVATQLPEQLEYYGQMQEIVWAMLEEGFSHQVIEPGVTTTEDMSWWFRDKMQILNVTTWNQPRISVIRAVSFPGWSGSQDIIQEGDLLHIDFGITALGLNTDTQHLAYVLRTSCPYHETDAPRSLKEGLRKANRMQDIVVKEMSPSLSGNQVLKNSLARMKTEGIEGQMYSHPIGEWGHNAGAVMGFTNLPEYVPLVGDLAILPDTYYSIELYASHFVPERNETLRFLLEENVAWSRETQTWQFVRGRQERFHLIDARKRGSLKAPGTCSCNPSLNFVTQSS